MQNTPSLFPRICKTLFAASISLSVSISFCTLPARASLDKNPLFLEVFINKNSTSLIAKFFRDSNGVFTTTIAELSAIGIEIPARFQGRKPETLVPLGAVPSLSYTYGESDQTLHIQIEMQQRKPKQYYPRKSTQNIDLSKSNIGAVLNYSIFASANMFDGEQDWFDQTAISLDGWIYSPFGNFYNSAIISPNFANAGWGDSEALRLESTWSYANPQKMTITNMGDVITGGLAWTNPVRLGGVQIQKNFGLRPDLITTPLFNASGSAAVPSTVDIYVGNFKAHSQKIDAGRFSINQVPSVSGNGNARIIVRDATGHEQISEKPFYISSKLLRQGLLDYSAEAGFARLNFGSKSNDYANRLFGSATFRYGVNDQLTLEAHGEASDTLLNAGIGTTFTFANRALIALAASASRTPTKTGINLYASLNTQIAGLNLFASTRRSFGDYQDLASLSETIASDRLENLTQPQFGATRRALDQVSIGIPLPALNGGMNIAFTHLEDVIGEVSNTLSLSYSQKIFKTASLSLSAYGDIEDHSNFGFSVGLSFPIGKRLFATSSVDGLADDIGYHTTISKFANNKPGSLGWRLSQTKGKTSHRSATVDYHGHTLDSQLQLHQNQQQFTANATINGALVAAPSGIFFSRRIDDAFAIVETGAPDIPVYLANNQIGTTNQNGKLLVPGLLSYEKNQLRIDPKNLPVNAHVKQTQQNVVPVLRAGVDVKFGIETNTRNAVVIFTDDQGMFIPAGSEITMAGTPTNPSQQFVVGYDGRAFLEHLSSENEVTINTQKGNCSARFSYIAHKGQQIEIGPVVCTN